MSSLWRLKRRTKVENVFGIIKGVLIVLLLLSSYQDIKKKEIGLLPMAIGIAIIFFLNFLNYENINWTEKALAVSIGGVLIFLSFISKGQIGIGDGLLFAVIGFGVGFWNSLSILMCSLLIASVFSCYLIIIKKKRKSTEIPFVPFVTIGYITWLIF